LCDKHGILLIADEVQTGFGRTGKMFAIEYSGVIPDLMTMAKSLAGGMPLSGVCGKAEIMDAPAPGALGGTYAGNPLALASALAVLDIIEDEQLLARANASGEKLRASLRALQAITPEIADIRGLGAMIAVEFKHADSGKPNPEFAGRVQKNALKNGLILLTCGIYGNVIRFLFPLTIPDQLLDEGLLILADAVKSSRA
jgi:4-aminobutyrate aminotransferase/4-aminobutyrate aminotransferase/(S)-3-amino-2-methylpropionate transaminase